MEKLAQISSQTWRCASDWYVYFYTEPAKHWFRRPKNWVLVHMDAGFGVKKKVKNRDHALKIHHEITTLAEKGANAEYKQLGWSLWNYFGDMSPYKNGYSPEKPAADVKPKNTFEPGELTCLICKGDNAKCICK